MTRWERDQFLDRLLELRQRDRDGVEEDRAEADPLTIEELVVQLQTVDILNGGEVVIR